MNRIMMRSTFTALCLYLASVTLNVALAQALPGPMEPASFADVSAPNYEPPRDADGGFVACWGIAEGDVSQYKYQRRQAGQGWVARWVSTGFIVKDGYACVELSEDPHATEFTHVEYRAQACNSHGCNEPTEPAPVSIKPQSLADIQGLVFAGFDRTQEIGNQSLEMDDDGVFEVRWSTVSGASTYRWRYQLDGNAWTDFVTVPSSFVEGQQTGAVMSLTPDKNRQSVQVEVQACSSSCQTPMADNKTGIIYILETDPPSQPGQITVSPLTQIVNGRHQVKSTHVHIEWGQSTGTVDGYMWALKDGDTVLYDNDSGIQHGDTWVFLQREGSSVTSYLTFEVYAVNQTNIPSPIRSIEIEQRPLNNTPPEIPPISPISNAGEIVSVQIAATDANQDRLHYSANGLPPGLFIDSQSGLVTGLLPHDSMGTYSVTVTVNDGEANTKRTFDWTVDVPFGNGLQNVIGLNFDELPTGHRRIFWTYPEDDFYSVTGRPAQFIVTGALPGSGGSPQLHEVITVGQGAMPANWETTVTDSNQFANAFRIQSCDSAGQNCSRGVTISFSSSTTNDDLPIPQWVTGSAGSTPTTNTNDIHLKWTVVDDPRIDYFEIYEITPAGAHLVYYTEDRNINLERLQATTATRKYNFTLKACTRLRNEQQDDCSESSAPWSVDVTQQYATPAAVEQVGWGWNDASQQRFRLTWGYSGDFSHNASRPDVFRLVRLMPGGAQTIEVYAHRDEGLWLSQPISDDQSGTWRISACKQILGATPECGDFVDIEVNTNGTPTVPEFPSTGETVVGGPGELHPGEWVDPDRKGTGWSFYWASELRYPSVHEAYGDTYDLIGYWMTYRLVEGQWRSVWLYAPMKLDQPSSTYRGALYYPRLQNPTGSNPQAELEEVGEVIVDFADPGSTQVSVPITVSVNSLSGLSGEVTTTLKYVGSNDAGIINLNCTSEENPIDHYRGLWWHFDANRKLDERFASLNWIEGRFESMIVPFYDAGGEPVWARGDFGLVSGSSTVQRDCNSDPTSEAQLDFSFYTIVEGFDPRDTTPDFFLQNGVIDAQYRRDIGFGGRRFNPEPDFRRGGIWLDLDLTSNDTGRSGVLTVGNPQSADFSVEKGASFHDVRFFINGQPETETQCNISNGACDVTLTWFSDDDFSSAAVFLCPLGASGNGCDYVESGWPTALNRPVEVHGAGSYFFELRKRNNSDAPAIARSVTLELVEVEAPQAFSAVPDAPRTSLARPGHDSEIGAVGGQAGVSGGAATYNIPIVIPPGRRGMQPSLSFSYSSRSGNGHLGMGWSISGLSSIHRCPSTVAQDDSAGSVQFDEQDKLCLDGQRLVLVDDGDSEYGDSGSEYRTEIDSFQRIVLNGNFNASDSTFTVQTKSGMVRTYGGANYATQTPHSAGIPLSWALSEEQDPSGNWIVYHYTAFDGGAHGEYGIQKITYTGHGADIGNREVTFIYQSTVRPDVTHSLLAGHESRQTQLLNSVETRIAGEIVRVYQLGYRLSDATGRSLVKEIQSCAIQDTAVACKPLTRIQWHDSQPQFLSEPGLTDLNGSGSGPATNPGSSNAFCNDNPTQCIIIDCPDPSGPEPDQCTFAPIDGIISLGDLRADYDGDGIREVIGGYRSAPSLFNGGGVLTGQRLVSLNSDGSTRGEIELGSYDGFQSLLGFGYREVDFDNDGRVDLVGSRPNSATGENHLAIAHWSGEHGYSIGGCADNNPDTCPFDVELTNIPYDPEWGQQAGDEIALGDFNRDSLMDVVVAKNLVQPSGNRVRAFYLWLRESAQINCRGSQPNDPHLSYHFCGVNADGIVNGEPQPFLEEDFYDVVPGINHFPDEDGFGPARLSGAIDLNGDGQLEIQLSLPVFTATGDANRQKLIVFASAGASGVEAYIADDTGDPNASGLGLAFDPEDVYHLQIDVNGDGLLDYLYLPAPALPAIDGRDRTWWVQLNTGRAWSSGQTLYGPGFDTDSRAGLMTEGWDPVEEHDLTSGIDRAANWRPKYAGLFQVADLNSDGRSELIFPSTTRYRSCTWVKRNIGDGTSPDGGNSTDILAYCASNLALNTSAGSNYGTVEVLNDSEDQDIYHLNGATLWDASIYGYSAMHFEVTSNGEVSISVSSPSSLEGSTQMRVGDLFGDGKTDAWSHYGHRIVNSFYVGLNDDGNSANQLILPCEVGQTPAQDGCAPHGFHWSRATERGERPVDHVESIVDGLDREATWIYKPLTFNGEGATGTPLYSVPDSLSDRYVDSDHFYFTSSMYVVQHFSQSNGIGGNNVTNYSYSEAMFNNKGRGFQGFHEIVSETVAIDSSQDLRTTSVFHQKHPLAGRPEKTYIHRVDDTLAFTLSAGNAIELTEYTWDQQGGCTLDDLVCFPFLKEQHTIRRHLNPAYRHWSVAETLVDLVVYDDYGNLKEQRTTITDFQPRSPAILKEVVQWQENSYLPYDTTNWWVNALTRSELTQSVTYGDSHAVPAAIAGDISADKVTTQLIHWDEAHRQPACTYQVSGSAAGLDNCSVSVIAAGPAPATKTHIQSFDSFGNPGNTVVEATGGTTAEITPRLTQIQYSGHPSLGYFVASVINPELHQIITETDPRYGQPIEITDANGLRTVFEYDPFGMEIERYYPIGSTQGGATDIANQYAPRSSTGVVQIGDTYCPVLTGVADSNGASYCVVNVTDGAPVVASYLDQLGRTIRTRSTGFGGVPVLTVMTYDALGRMAEESRPYYPGGTGINAPYNSIQRMRFQYDALGRMTRKSQPRQNFNPDLPFNLDNPGGAPLTSYLVTHYLHEGNETTIWVGNLPTAPMNDTCAAGSTGFLNDRLCVQRQYASDGSLVRTVDAHGSVTKFWLDAQGSPVGISDPAGNLTRASYNNFGQRTQLNDPNMGEWQFTYNGLGELVFQNDAKGQQIHFVYDELGRLLERSVVGGEVDQWHFDPPGFKGQLQYEQREETDGGLLQFRRDYAYDVYQRPITQTTTIHRLGADAETFTVESQYDTYYGRPLTMTYPDADFNDPDIHGLSIYQKYDDYGYLLEEREAADWNNTSSSYRPLRRIAATTPSGQLIDVHYGNERRIRNNFFHTTGQMRRVKLHRDAAASETDGLDTKYYYDLFGNLVFQRNMPGSQLAAVETFAYDRLHRLRKSHRDYYGISESTGLTELMDQELVGYTYDALGNITSKDDFSSNYQYNGTTGGPNAVNAVLVDGALQTYDYDANGNMVSGTLGSLGIAYDAHNKPVTVARNSTTLQFGYASNQQRIWQLKGITEEETLYIDKLYERIGGQNGEHKYYLGYWAVWTVGGNDAGIKYLHRDRLGSIMVISDQFAALEGDAGRGFDPFGKPRNDDWRDSQNGLNRDDLTTRGFTAHEHLNDVELIHMNGRAYDYNLGRFLSVDPFIQFPENSQSLNSYSYLMNNPMGAVDPSGYLAECDASTLGEGGTTQCDIFNSKNHTRTTVEMTRNADGSVTVTQISAPKDNGGGVRSNFISGRSKNGAGLSPEDINSTQGRTQVQEKLAEAHQFGLAVSEVGQEVLNTINPGDPANLAGGLVMGAFVKAVKAAKAVARQFKNDPDISQALVDLDLAQTFGDVEKAGLAIQRINGLAAKRLALSVDSKFQCQRMCVGFASELQDKLAAAGIKGERLNLQSVTDFIQSDKHGIITENGFHTAIRVGDTVFDNLNPGGIGYGEFIEDLGGKYFIETGQIKLSKEVF